jgi:hypothetical protein
LLDPESKLVVSLVVGRRTAETALEAFLDFYERTDGCLPELITTDEYAPYLAVIVSVYGVLKEDLERVRPSLDVNFLRSYATGIHPCCP